MTKFSDVVRFINTCHPDRRDGLLKTNLDDLTEGESIFHKSLHDYYQIRPLQNDCLENNWDDMCLADFAAEHNIVPKPKTGSKSSKGIIKLQDEKSFISKRKRPSVIRYFLKYDNEVEYYRALCILFLPFRNEVKDIHSKNVKDLYFAKQEIIEKNRTNFEKYKILIEAVEEAEKKGEELDELDEEEEESTYIEEETTDDKDIEDFEKSLRADAKKILSNFNDGSNEMNEENYLDIISNLNVDQQKNFHEFVERINGNGDPFYLYIGGEAGTGKSFVLRAMINAAKKIGKRSGADLDKPACLTVAPTGVAAYLVMEPQLKVV